MALLANSKDIVDNHTERRTRYIGVSGATEQYRDDAVCVYEWACDDSGGESLQSELSSPWVVEWYGLVKTRGEPHAMWREIYRNKGSWTEA